MRLSGGSPSGTTGPPQHGAALTGQNVVLGGDKSEVIRKNMQKALKYFSLSGIGLQPAYMLFKAVPTHAYMLIGVWDLRFLLMVVSWQRKRGTWRRCTRSGRCTPRASPRARPAPPPCTPSRVSQHMIRHHLYIYDHSFGGDCPLIMRHTSRSSWSKYSSSLYE